MMCSRISPLSLSPMMDFHWPVRSLWPETHPLFFQIEQEMMRHMQEMKQSLEFMEKLHQKIFDEIDHVPATMTLKPISYRMDSQGEKFAVTLDTKEFSPEELSVKQVGKKLRVSGKTEKKQEDGKGSYSYRCQQFRQEFDLPEGVNPEEVTCSLTNGQLQIHAPVPAVSQPNERVVPIECVSSAKPLPAETSEEAAKN